MRCAENWDDRIAAVSAELFITNGRVIDPLSGFDGVADVAVSGGRVTEIGPGLQGRETLDATGMVVAPGFIDLHSHVHTVVGQRLQAHDGVTTALDLEVGLSPTARAYQQAADEGRPLNYGYSASWAALRMQVLAGVTADGNVFSVLAHLGDPKWQRQATETELPALIGALETELAAGALGVGVIVGYAPGTGPDEYLAVAAAASRAGRPVFTHARELIESDPDVRIDGPTEIVRAAAETGAQMHYCHINSTSRRHVDRVLELVDRCRHEGGRVSTEAYPYGAGATAIGAAFLDPDKLDRWEITPRSIIYLPTGEHVADVARLRQLRAEDPGGVAIIEVLDESDPTDRGFLARGLLSPDTMIASDAMPPLVGGLPVPSMTWPIPAGAMSHPRAAGTFSKTLRQYVREQGTLELTEAIRRSSTLPALLLETMSPAMRRKGRLSVGADADVVVFDPVTVSDRATYADSCRLSTGFRHVVVNGVPLIRDGVLDPDAMPGKPIRAA